MHQEPFFMALYIIADFMKSCMKKEMDYKGIPDVLYYTF